MRNFASREDVSGTPQMTRLKYLRKPLRPPLDTVAARASKVELLSPLRVAEMEFKGDQGEDSNNKAEGQQQQAPARQTGNRLPSF
jgi:hypothetical protein